MLAVEVSLVPRLYLPNDNNELLHPCSYPKTNGLFMGICVIHGNNIYVNSPYNINVLLQCTVYIHTIVQSEYIHVNLLNSPL